MYYWDTCIPSCVNDEFDSCVSHEHVALDSLPFIPPESLNGELWMKGVLFRLQTQILEPCYKAPTNDRVVTE